MIAERPEAQEADQQKQAENEARAEKRHLGASGWNYRPFLQKSRFFFELELVFIPISGASLLI